MCSSSTSLMMMQPQDGEKPGDTQETGFIRSKTSQERIDGYQIRAASEPPQSNSKTLFLEITQKPHSSKTWLEFSGHNWRSDELCCNSDFEMFFGIVKNVLFTWSGCTCLLLVSSIKLYINLVEFRKNFTQKEVRIFSWPKPCNHSG